MDRATYATLAADCASPCEAEEIHPSAEDRRGQALHFAQNICPADATELVREAKVIEAFLEGAKDPPPPAILVEHLVKAAAAVATCPDPEMYLSLELTGTGVRIRGQKRRLLSSRHATYVEISKSSGYALMDRIARVAMELRSSF